MYLLKRGIVPGADQNAVLPQLPVAKSFPCTQQWTPLVLSNPIIIVNVQKMHRRPNAIWTNLPGNSFGLIIIDEAHHFPSTFWSAVINHFAAAKVLFLTATPFRTDGQLVVTTPAAYRLTRTAATNSNIIHVTVYTSIPGQNVTEQAAQQAILQLVWQTLQNQPALAGVVPHLALVIAKDKAACDDVANLATAVGIPNLPYHTNCDNLVRKLYTFKTAGQPRILVICQMLLEGFDCPPVSVLGICTGIRSPVKFDQFVGRGVRRMGLADLSQTHIITHEFYDQDQNYIDYINETFITV